MTNQEVFDLADKYIMNTYKRFPIALKNGEGAYLYDYDGNEYLDFLAGISVNALGYNHPVIKETIHKLGDGLFHTSNLFYTKNQAQLAKLLIENSDLDKVFFCNSGAEANESAIKLARKWGKGRYEIIVMYNSFHGRTMGALSATGQTKYQKGFEPVLPGFKFVNYNNFEELEKAITDLTVAIMLEPLQAEGGIIIPSKDYIKNIEKLCKEKNLLLILDEVQTGICRTGKLFAYQHYDIEPDIITLAKALGGGLPIGAMLAKSNIASAFEPGNHASTFGGGEFVTGVAFASLHYLIEEKIYLHAAKMGEYFLSELKNLAAKYKTKVKEARGLGLLCGLELEDKISLSDFGNSLLKRGLLTAAAGTNVVRFAPPLIIQEEHINKAISIIDNVLTTI
ncbi:MAG TPA: aspartate aminotransferase family protein [Ignavibacteria bacterium]